MAIEDTKNMINALDKGDTVEAEKEITAFDDMILAFVVLIYIFG